MTVKLELRPDVESELSLRAHARGLPLDTYLQRMIEDLVHAEDRPTTNAQSLRGALDTLAEMGKDLPRLPLSALSRESIYGDHD